MTKSIIAHLMTPAEVAEYLGVSKETLNVWRCTKRYNLPYVKTGRLVRYRAEDVANFVTSRLQGDAT
jgi:excisionase family DNA binding protein